jgi:ABC-type cobalt transport system, ATPase component
MVTMDASRAERIIELRDVHAGHRGAPVLRGASLTLHAGERIALAGPNGAGKSTLLRVMVGLLKPKSGTVWAFGQLRTEERDFVPVRLRAGLVFQDADDQLFSPTVLDDVAFGPRNQGLTAEAARDRAHETLATLGLAAHADRLTHHLSGGEKRLVALATVLAMQPDAMLLDEPFAGLDEDAERRVKSILDRLSIALLVVTHDLGIVSELSMGVRTLDAGVVR